MRTLESFLAVGLFTAVSAGCKGSPSSEKAPEARPVETAAEIKPSAEDGEDGACKGDVCVARCDKLSRPEDCLKAGEAYRMGIDGVTASPATALKYLEKACARKDRETTSRRMGE